MCAADTGLASVFILDETRSKLKQFIAVTFAVLRFNR